MSKVREADLCIEDCAILSTFERAKRRLKLPDSLDLKLAQTRLEALLDKMRKPDFDEEVTDQLIASLAMLWGMALSRAYDWEVIAVEFEDWRGLGFSDKERKYLALPISLFHKLVTSSNPPELAAAITQFKEVAAGKLPASSPGALVVVAS